MHRLLSGPLSVEKVTIPIQNLPQRLEGVVIAQLSDFHFDGLRLSHELLESAISRIEALQPDLVALTGDFVTDDPTPIYELTNRIKHLPSRYGTFAVLGNHDIAVKGAREEITAALEKVDIPVLWNAIATPLGADFPLVGFADYWSREFDPQLLTQIDNSLPRLVLSHNPDTAEHLSTWRVDLQLSGHTHGGQVNIPGLGSGPQVWKKIRQQVPKSIRNKLPFLNDKCFHVTKHWEWHQGLHKVSNNWLYVNRGLGTYFPGRFFCPPELSILTLVRA